MPKHGFLTPKAIANRIKAKGLQKLRWYCQMCQKQCRDQNGFKCHIQSESHQRQMKLFSDKPNRFLDQYSREFSSSMIGLIRHRWRNTRVHANVVYNEYIKDRHHIHMNATQWTTLSGFVRYLGKKGICEIEETPKGWYLTYIDRDPETIAKQESQKRKHKSEMDDAERERKRIAKQVKAAQKAKEKSDPGEQTLPARIERSESDKVAFKISTRFAKPETPIETLDNDNETKAEEKEETHDSSSSTKRKREEVPSRKPVIKSQRKATRWDKPAEGVASKRSKHKDERDSGKKLSALEQIMQREEQAKERANRKDYWLTPGIVVKVMNKDLMDGKFYKEKARVNKVEELYIGIVKIISTGERMRIDQDQLETVIPGIGGRVRIVNGAYRGCTAVLESVDFDNFCVSVKIDAGPNSGRRVSGVEYEDVCKLG